MARSLALALGAALALPFAAGVALLRDEEAEDVRQARLWLSPAQAKKTVVFVAGIEGSGHHFIHAVVDAAIQQQHKKITRVWMPKAWTCGEVWKESGIDDMAEKLQALPDGEAYILEDIRSYPECGVFKGYVEHEERLNLYHPHLPWIKQAVEKAGGQLRVIFLYRDMEDCLAANCLHRTIDFDCHSEAEVLKKNSVFLASDIYHMNAGDVSCFEYGKMDTMIASLKAAFGESIMTDQLVKHVWQDAQRGEDNRLNVDKWYTTVDSIKEGAGALKGLCKQYRQLSLRGLARLFDNSTASNGALMLERQT